MWLLKIFYKDRNIIKIDDEYLFEHNAVESFNTITQILKEIHPDWDCSEWENGNRYCYLSGKFYPKYNNATIILKELLSFSSDIKKESFKHLINPKNIKINEKEIES